MPERLLIANRGEIAVRIAHSAAAEGIATVGIFAADDANALHCRRVDTAVPLAGRGVSAYLDGEQLLAVARAEGCDAIHPGYGFLAENADFAARCAAEGVVFIGPTPEQLQLFGNKVSARRFAADQGVVVLPGTDGAADIPGMQAFFATLPAGAAMVIKAVAGGGGRGMRVVREAGEIPGAFERAASEAGAAFGNPELYAERFAAHARHLEVQIIGDGNRVVHLWERECTLQRRHQKVIEMAPSPSIDESLRAALCDAAATIAGAARYRGAGTFEFLLFEGSAGPEFVFMEANPRIQVEHTVTESILDLDIVALQLRLADGASLQDLGLERSPQRGRRLALQARVNMETMMPDGATRPAGGTLRSYEPPSGPGVRVDGYGYSGYTSSPAYDSLLAKVIVTEPGGHYSGGLARLTRALAEFRIDGIDTNRSFLLNLLQHPDVIANRIHTEFIDQQQAALIGIADTPQRYFETADGAAEPALEPSRAAVPEGQVAVDAPMQGTVIECSVAVGDRVQAGQPLLVMDAMKMEHLIPAPVSGIVRQVDVVPQAAVFEGHRLLLLEPAAVAADAATETDAVDPDLIRPDLQETLDRHAFGLDENRQDAVARRHGRGHRTARENIEDLVDPGTFLEYGPLVIAAQRRRRSVADLMARTPGDGMVAGIGCINGDLFGQEHTRCVAMSYDYMVLAGTQGHMNHLKKDRLFELAEQEHLPLVLFAEGGGGRPGDTDGVSATGLDCFAFNYFARLSGLVPTVGITNGYCFAGNAALLGCCDVIIATEGSNIGMGGPAMIEGGGLGVFEPKEIGPLSVQVPNGVVDVVVPDEAAAVAVAKRYLSYFQGAALGRLNAWEAPDQRMLRHLIPENRLRVYDIRRVIEQLADTDSVLELRPEYGIGMITTLARFEGRPVGIIANNPAHLSGAIDAPGADKAARFMQLCDAFDLPILMLCDTPGFMVGPEAERSAQVRRFARMFVVGANLQVPFFTIVLRKGYGLGAQAMAGGSFKTPLFTVAWPTGEFGGMGLEGAVKLGYRNELAAIEDPEERERTYQDMVQRMYDRGKAVATASAFDIDEVIDPAESRHWIRMALESSRTRQRQGKRRPCVDTW